MKQIRVGDYWGKGRFRKQIKEIRRLSNGWYLIKTENAKSKQDFKVKVVFALEPQHSMTPKHAHFLIDFYGKLCADEAKAKNVLNAIYKVWQGEGPDEVLSRYAEECKGLPGYPLEYILNALNWILEQEDINFTSRPEKKQRELDEICAKQGIRTPVNRKGSQLAISLFCDVAGGTHPVEALIKANLDISPRGR